jgi:hypothetical protein
MKTILIALLLMLFSITCQAFDLKGIEIGSVRNDVLINEKLGIDCGSYSNVCSDYTMVMGRVSTVILSERDGKIGSITVVTSVMAFDDLVEALKKKHGDPKTVERSNWQAMSGVQLANISMQWINTAGDELTVTKYGNSTQSILTMKSHAQIKFEDAKSKTAKSQL